MLAVLIEISTAAAQTITTAAGTGFAGFGGDGGLATAAALNNPRGVSFDASGNMYIADKLNHRIRRVSPAGTITTFAGTGTAGFSGDGGAAGSAQLNQPEDVIVDTAGNVYIADSSNHRIRKVTAGGTISTVAGIGSFGFNGDNIAAVNAQLNRPTSIALDAAGNLYIADSSNHRVRRVATSGTITTVAGTGVQGFSGNGGQATSATLRFPVGVALDTGGNLYIADAGNHVVREVSTNGVIFNAAGNGAGAGTDTGSFSGDGGLAVLAGLNTPEDVVVDTAGTLFIADTANYRVRKVTTSGSITTFAGTGSDGFSGDGGSALLAQFNLPWSVAMDGSGNLAVGDMLNHRIRRIAGAGAPGIIGGSGGGGGGGAPTVSAGGAVNGASFRKATDPGGAIAAGAIVSVFGNDLATTTLNASTVPLPTDLGGTSVTFNGVAAPLFFVSPTQINVQVPFTVPAGSVSVQVTRSGTAGPAQSVSLAAFSPGIFTNPPGGAGAGAILHANFVPVSGSAPAQPGEVLLIFCTGLGAVQPPVASGGPGPTSPPSQTTSTPLVTIAGIPAQVSFSGLAPTFVGLYQVNVQVPLGTPAGPAVPLVLTIGGTASNTVTIAVQ